MQVVLKNSREELLKAFRKEYNAKRTAKATQASHTDNLPKQADHVIQVEILPQVDIRVLEYDLEERQVKSARRPRRDAVPRAYTPPPRKDTRFKVMPWRDAISNDEKQEITASEMAERQEDMEMYLRKEERFRLYQQRLK
jgi:hypothetical protein